MWLRGWLAHQEWLRVRIADRTLYTLLRDTPARSLICQLCNTYGPLRRQVDGPAGPAAMWLCYQCLLDMEVAHFIGVPGQPRNGQSSVREFITELLLSYRSLRFIEDDRSACRASRMYRFCYELLSLVDEETDPNITISVSDSATGPRGYRKHRRGYLNCGLDMSSDQHSLFFLRFATHMRAGRRLRTRS